MIQPLFNSMLAILLAKFCLNDIPHAAGLAGNPKRYVPPEEKYHMVRRTRRGSLVTIERVGNNAVLEITNYEDMTSISNLLNAAGIKWTTYAKEDTFIPREKRYGRVLVVEFDFSELERVVKDLPLMLE